MNKKEDEIVINKSRVLQDTKLFNTSNDNTKIKSILNQLIMLLCLKQVNEQEQIQVFYNITKLLNNQNFIIRKLVYLSIRELTVEDRMMVTAILIKDLSTEHKTSAIRLLTRIGTLQQIERFIKQIIVASNPFVSTCGLVTGVDKRFQNEISECMSSNNFNQYHAVAAMYQIKQKDKVSLLKMVNSVRSRQPHAICMLIRYTWKLIEDGENLYSILEQHLRNKNDMVVYEAARAISNLTNVTPNQLNPAVSALQLLLVNHQSVLRFAAIRQLNALAHKHPQAVSQCNSDLENLITDSNTSIATFAITTLLKTGNEQNVDRLMIQITGFMNEISDDFKTIVVDAVRLLCLKFPSKHLTMLSFLKDILRDEGGYEYKKAIVEAVFDIINYIPEAKDTALEHLCEFIEDCDHAKLAVRVLHVLGVEGPRTDHPTKYVRYIYNRVILENSVVRAAAVSALAKFGETEAKNRILVLLERCSRDSDDEVRDRAVMYLNLLKEKTVANKYINNGGYQWQVLEHQLQQYMESGDHQEEFDIAVVGEVSQAEDKMEAKRQKDAKSEIVGLSNVEVAPVAKEEVSFAKIMSNIPDLKKLGLLMSSSQPILITEPEEEYVVKVIKHLFNEHLVFEFVVKNTLEDYILEKVVVNMTAQSPIDLKPLFLLPVEKISHGETASLYCCFQRAKGTMPVGVYDVVFKFEGRDCDPESGVIDDQSYPDEFSPEGITVSIGDYVSPGYSTVSEFESNWTKNSVEAVETFQLDEVSTAQEVKSMVESQMGLTCISVDENNGRGLVRGCGKAEGNLYYGKIQFVIAGGSVTMQVSVRGPDERVCNLLADFIQ